MKICITGALGHIGSKLIRELKHGQFSEIRIIDNLSTQRYPSLFNLPVKVKFFEADILTTNLNEIFKGIDVVIHLAAITDAASSFDNPTLVNKVNYLGTQKVAKACIKNGCSLFFPSTTSVYGTQKGIVDEQGKLKPQSPYAESKLKAENYLIKQTKLKFVICRFGTIFGPSVGMRFHTAVNKFIWQAVIDEPLTVWKTALNQKRPYLDLNDAINAINFIIYRNLFNGEIYNVLTANYTVADILKVIQEYIPDFGIDYVKTKIMNQLSYEVDDTKFRKTGFRYHGNLEERIKETVDLLT